ncbi:MAG: hypothetical protein J6J42_05045 [Lachnospiraceae bacterium]|nr:hypothetical protein [Lachnospiraceae bacterium]
MEKGNDNGKSEEKQEIKNPLEAAYRAYADCKKEEKKKEYWSELYNEFETFAYRIAGRQIYVQGISMAEYDNMTENAVMVAITELFYPKKNGEQSLLDRYEEKNGGSFTGYCSTLVRRKAITEVNKTIRKKLIRVTESTESAEEEGKELPNLEMEVANIYADPEAYYQEQERKEELINCAKLIMNALAAGPLQDYAGFNGAYRTVGGAFSKYLPYFEDVLEKNEKSAPTWAYRLIQDTDVKKAATGFQNRINQCSPKMEFCWEKKFLEKVEHTAGDDGYATFAEKTVIKNFEHWAEALHREVMMLCAVELEEKYREITDGSISEINYEEVVRKALKKSRKKSAKKNVRTTEKSKEKGLEL